VGVRTRSNAGDVLNEEYAWPNLTRGMRSENEQLVSWIIGFSFPSQGKALARGTSKQHIG
jgi:hypothetical protein